MQYRPYTSGAERSPLAALTQRPRQPRLASNTRIPENKGPGPYGRPDPWMPRPTAPRWTPQDGNTPQYQPPAQTGGTTPTGAGDQPGPYANDPVYQQIVALSRANEQDAESSAEAQRKQLAIQLGDPSLAGSLHLGQGTADAAQANAFSTLKNLLRGHNANVTGVDQGANHANLFYSSAHNQGLQQEQTNYQGNKAAAYSAAQGQLAQIAAILLAAHRAAQQQRSDAAGAAYDRHKGDQPTPEELALYQLLNIGTAKGPADTSALTDATKLRLLGG